MGVCDRSKKSTNERGKCCWLVGECGVKRPLLQITGNSSTSHYELLPVQKGFLGGKRMLFIAVDGKVFVFSVSYFCKVSEKPYLCTI